MYTLRFYAEQFLSLIPDKLLGIRGASDELAPTPIRKSSRQSEIVSLLPYEIYEIYTYENHLYFDLSIN